MTTQAPLEDWERDLPIDPLGPDCRAGIARRREIVISHLREMTQDGTAGPGDWERSEVIAAAEEATRYPDPAALLPAVHWRHGSLGQTATRSGCMAAARAAVAELAAGLGQQSDQVAAGHLVDRHIRGDAMKVFSFDAETNGLWGPVFAIGAVLREDGAEVSRFGGRCPVEGTPDPWVAENVVPVVAGLAGYATREALLAAFAAYYLACKDGAEVVVHMGTPVEAGLLIEMHKASLIGDWDGPYPLIDVAGCLRQAGHDPTSVDSYAAACGIAAAGSAHDPVYDAAITALVFEHLAGCPA